MVQLLSSQLGISGELATLFAQRGLKTEEEVKSFVNPNPKQLHDPFLMKDMDKAVDLTLHHLKSGNKIMILGDYDVDGTSSVALMRLFLTPYDEQLISYIPNREKEGYGVSIQAIETAKSNEVSLIISLDCGIKAMEQIELARSMGIDFIVCDHHSPADELPPANAILNPKQKNCPYPFKELSGCGVGFKLCCGLRMKESILPNPFEFIDLLALSIGCDIVSLTGENRVLAHIGLNKLNEDPIVGLKALKEVSAYQGTYTISDVVFKLGPRINAAGRMGSAMEATLLLGSMDDSFARSISEDLNSRNNARKEVEQRIVIKCIDQIEADRYYRDATSLVVAGKEWHKGVIGIVAAKLCEHYYLPSVVFTEQSDGIMTGSARSIDGFNLYEALNSCKFLFEGFGGHKAAAGIRMKAENFHAFRDIFDDICSASLNREMRLPKLFYSLEISPGALSRSFYKSCERLGPFGPDNMKPLFVSRNISLRNVRILGEKHLKFSVSTDKGIIDAIGFGLADAYKGLNSPEKLDLCYSLEENNWQGRCSLQLNIKDLHGTNEA